jgi:transcriptional regulator with XRE-family HTH domain
MKKMKTYKSVSHMVRETADGSFADSFDRRLHDRRIVKNLMVTRAGRGLSQTDLAQRMGCSQSRVSKLESSEDLDLTLGDLARYASAVGFRVAVALEPKDLAAVSRVKRLAFQIKDELDRLAGLAHGDHQIAQGVAAFLNEAFFNLVDILQKSAEKLPCNPEDGEPFISFGIMEGGACPESETSRPAPAPEPQKSPRKRGRPKMAEV